MTRREALRAAAAAALAVAPGRPAHGRDAPEASRGAMPPARKEGARTMHLGIVTYNVARDWDLDTLLGICRETGMEGVEFRTTHAHGVEPSLGADARKAVREKCAAAGVRQTSLGTVCEFHSPDRRVIRANVDTCRAFIDLARDIGARGVKVRPNRLAPGEDAAAVLARIGAALAECGEIGAASGVEIWMEVHGEGTMLPANARAIMDACGHPNVGVTWNSNRADVEGGSLRHAFDLLRPFIRCCHITELWNDYPWRELFGLLRRARYERFTLCEIPATVRAEDGATFLRCYGALWKELQR